MNKISASLAALAGLVLVMGLAACAPKKSPGPPPPWLEPGAAKSDHEFFYGIGCAPREINNTWFQKATADERARVDLAKNVNAYLLTQLAGDTTAARAVIERALPSREANESYLTDKGELCIRARLARGALAVTPPPARE
jgi:hypothetical protein